MSSEEPLQPARTPDEATGHLDLDLAADLDAGLLEPDEAVSWRRHAAGCPRCTALLASIADVRDGLAELRQVEPVPAALRARWTTGLSARPDALPEPPPAPSAPAARARRRPRPNRSLVQLGAVAAACFAVYGLTRVLPDTGGASDSSGSSGAAAAPAASAAASAGAAAESAASAAAGGGSSRTTSAPAASAATGAAPAAPSGVVLATTPAGIEAQARVLLTGAYDLSDSPALPPACLGGLGGAAPELVLPGSFRGRSALLVVQPVGASRLRLTVVRQPCGAEQAREPLLVTDAARPGR
ncbi:hypothetical protein CLV35_0804 [Motilibacter peucedani]|uniref:Uncharacterized protein n=1 Tax=Motilibacter peucedani TaxID=598650 RepID=A0A420XU53_9ACTN|nr:hypothetical protein [Motilibacter peucedani]RKS80373.1 hypothetical protein CLV35_0804 [Motilibacter peucedani]